MRLHNIDFVGGYLLFELSGVALVESAADGLEFRDCIDWDAICWATEETERSILRMIEN